MIEQLIERLILEGKLDRGELDALIAEGQEKNPVPGLVKITNKLKTASELYQEALLDENISLDALRAAKMEELNEECNLAIINGFTHTVEGTEYLFSCSLSAQSNFQGTDALFKDGFITEAEWTAVNVATGEVCRVVLNQTDFNSVKLQVFQHINTNIGKFRNELQPKVEAATKEEVDSIRW